MKRVSGAHAASGDADPALRSELERVSQLRIFFGHQSVGVNLLDGLQALAALAGVALRIAETLAVDGVGPATLGHQLVAENGDPLKKIQNFERAVERHRAGLDVALLKFCYLDIIALTDPNALFTRYRAAVDRLREANPATAIVHVTAPLTDVQTGPRALLRRLFHRPPYGALDNLRREEYNALLRETYRGREPLFDLARIESTDSHGITASVQWNGRAAPAMAPENTDDGGHLNAAGSLRAARVLVSVLAAVRLPATAAPAR